MVAGPPWCLGEGVIPKLSIELEGGRRRESVRETGKDLVEDPSRRRSHVFPRASRARFGSSSFEAIRFARVRPQKRRGACLRWRPQVTGAFRQCRPWKSLRDEGRVRYAHLFRPCPWKTEGGVHPSDPSRPCKSAVVQDICTLFRCFMIFGLRCVRWHDGTSMRVDPVPPSRDRAGLLG